MAETLVYAFIYLESSECVSMPTARPQDTAALTALGWWLLLNCMHQLPGSF